MRGFRRYKSDSFMAVSLRKCAYQSEEKAEGKKGVRTKASSDPSLLFFIFFASFGVNNETRTAFQSHSPQERIQNMLLFKNVSLF